MTIANAVGNGAADDKLVYTYVPDLIRYYLGEEPLLDNIETHRLEDPDVLAWTLEQPATRWCSSRSTGPGGKGIVIGPQASEAGARRAAGYRRRRPARLDRAAARSGSRRRRR